MKATRSKIWDELEKGIFGEPDNMHLRLHASFPDVSSDSKKLKEGEINNDNQARIRNLLQCNERDPSRTWDGVFIEIVRSVNRNELTNRKHIRSEDYGLHSKYLSDDSKRQTMDLEAIDILW